MTHTRDYHVPCNSGAPISPYSVLSAELRAVDDALQEKVLKLQRATDVFQVMTPCCYQQCYCSQLMF
jgi:hypothetical protein